MAWANYHTWQSILEMFGLIFQFSLEREYSKYMYTRITAKENSDIVFKASGRKHFVWQFYHFILQETSGEIIFNLYEII